MTPSDCRSRTLLELDGASEGSFVAPQPEGYGYVEISLTARGKRFAGGASRPTTVTIEYDGRDPGLHRGDVREELLALSVPVGPVVSRSFD